MRVLWLCNMMLPAIAESLGLPFSNKEGWLTGIYERLAEEKNNMDSPELGICFPVEKMPEQLVKENGRFCLGTTICYGFCEDVGHPEVYDERLEESFRRILDDFKPDMVHIFGTEFPHALAMVKAYERPERTLVGVQGLCFACARDYMADLPQQVQRKVSFRDLVKQDSIRQQQEKFRIRGEREKEVLQKVGHITGRTEFDREETGKINPDARYHFMNETMRQSFYSGNWEIEHCSPCSIFLSQGDYPLKGFHYVLLALPEIIKKFPDTRVYVAGNSIIENKTWKEKLKLSAYGSYLLGLIRESGCEDRVKVLGKLTAEQMKDQFLKTSVFVCPSCLENSPNSLGEAMLLGVPVVAAAVGGIPSMIEDGREGILFERGNTKKLAQSVMEVWKHPQKALERAEAAKKRAASTHHGDQNYRRLMEIYGDICQ